MSKFSVRLVDVDEWVESAKENPREYSVRRVIKVILFSIARFSDLKSDITIKGGVLLALGYGTDRHTKDVDFSTGEYIQNKDIDGIVTRLDNALSRGQEIDEEVLCKVQSKKVEPKRSDASFPTLRISIGYAFQGEKQYRRMVQGRDSTNTVKVDLSFNEHTCIASVLELGSDTLTAYSLYDQIAEKFRAMIQQTAERRGRVRRQEVYDIYSVIQNGYLESAEDKATLFSVMKEKFSARGVAFTREVIDEPEVEERSRKEYFQLENEIDGDLPDFDEAFGVVREFFVSLPWSD